MGSTLLVYLCVLHFVGDFLLQSREMGQKKSSSPKWLFRHVAVILGVFYVGAPWLPGTYAIKNALFHAAIDAVTWNLYKLAAGRRIKSDPWHELLDQDRPERPAAQRWQYWRDHWFYATIGFDQLLHVATILLVYEGARWP